MKQETATVLEHHNFQGDYRILRLNAPAVGPLVRPGQFLHLQIPQLGDRILQDFFNFEAGFFCSNTPFSGYVFVCI